MSELDRAILERDSTRMFFCLGRCRRSWWIRPSLWPSMRRRTPTSSRGGWMFVSGAARGRLKDALFSVADHEAPRIPALPKSSSITAMSLGRRFTARWVSPSRTRRDARPP